MKDDDKPPFVAGIDALYYFAQSGGNYWRFYEDIIEQIELRKQEFKALDYAYNDNDIIVTINTIDVKFSGTGRDGFLWFNHEFFRVGFKDSEKAQNIHNIRVQLNSIGIYTLGIKSLVEYINEVFLKGALLTPKYFPVTRIDVNMFIQHNFNYLHKDMVLSKKKNHSANISERSSGYELETYYVGKKPFMLRIYNKLKELESASETKRELMHNYFLINGLDTRKSIFNVEFEMHREFLKQYDIDTIEDALSSSNRLFHYACELVKLIDTSSISEKQLNSKNRYKADTLSIWEHISKSYDNKEFMQIKTPLQKIEKISYRYSLEDARKPIKRIITRLLLHENPPTLFYFYELLQNSKDEFALRAKYKELREQNKHSEMTFAESLKTYSNEGLMNFEKVLSKEMQGTNIEDIRYDELVNTYNELHEEMVLRGLVEFPF
jgi:hypothetical protein